MTDPDRICRIRRADGRTLNLTGALHHGSNARTVEFVAAWYEENRPLLEALAALPDSDRQALGAIAAERARQIAVEGWSIEHDDAHHGGELAKAAACYAVHHVVRTPHMMRWLLSSLWPWDRSWWKPKFADRNLRRSGALLVAELSRLYRKLAVAHESKAGGEG